MEIFQKIVIQKFRNLHSVHTVIVEIREFRSLSHLQKLP